MDKDGYLKIVDFGLAKKLNRGKSWTLCGTPDYPKLCRLNEGHDWAVDYWALGVLIYEMTNGVPPFYADEPMCVYEKVSSMKRRRYPSISALNCASLAVIQDPERDRYRPVALQPRARRSC